MKDYKLSDAKAICEKMNFNCKHCMFGVYQYYGDFWGCYLQVNPRYWQIEKETDNERLYDNRDN